MKKQEKPHVDESGPRPGDEFMVYNGVHSTPGHGTTDNWRHDGYDSTVNWSHYFIGEHGGIATESFEIPIGSIIRVKGDCELHAPRTGKSKKNLLEVVINDKYTIKVKKEYVHEGEFNHCNVHRLVRYYGEKKTFTCQDCTNYKKCYEYNWERIATERQIERILGEVE